MRETCPATGAAATSAERPRPPPTKVGICGDRTRRTSPARRDGRHPRLRLEQRRWRRAWTAARVRCPAPCDRRALGDQHAFLASDIRIPARHAVAGDRLGLVATAAMWWRRRYPLVGVRHRAGDISGRPTCCCRVGFALLTIAVQRRDRVLVVCDRADRRLCLLPSPVVGHRRRSRVAAVVAACVGALFWALWGAYVGARRDLVSSPAGPGGAGRAGTRTAGRTGQARRAGPDRQGDA